MSETSVLAISIKFYSVASLSLLFVISTDSFKLQYQYRHSCLECAIIVPPGGTHNLLAETPEFYCML